MEIRRVGEITEREARASLEVFVRFPQRYLKEIELSGHPGTLELRDLRAERVEFSGKAARVLLDGVSGHVELNSNEDLEIRCGSLDGRLDVNQVSSASRLFLPAEIPFVAVTRGSANHICYEKGGNPVEDFSRKDEEAGPCDNVIELNGMKSELIISAVTGPVLED